MQSEIKSALRYLRWQRLASLAWPGRPTRWRDVPHRLRPTAINVIRLTTAAVLSYLITLALTSGAIDLTGPLTALLVMQASAFSTLKMGAVRVGAVLAGVLIATLVSIWIGLTWWSLGAVIAASLVAAKVLRDADAVIHLAWLVQVAPVEPRRRATVPPLARSGFAGTAGSVPDARCRAPRRR